MGKISIGLSDGYDFWLEESEICKMEGSRHRDCIFQDLKGDYHEYDFVKSKTRKYLKLWWKQENSGLVLLNNTNVVHIT